MTGGTPVTRKTVYLPHNCDSVEVSPDLHKIFVGMYEYEESSSTRGGGFVLLNRDGEISAQGLSTEFGALDAKWIDDTKLILACSDGVIRTVNGENGEIVASLPVVDNPGSNNTGNILMTIDAVESNMATITAKGEISLICGDRLVSKIQAHSSIVESWSCALSPESAALVASGSDDCTLKFWDTRSSELVLENKRSHTMGTTCIEFLDNPNEVLTGSYDDRIRRFDMRNINQPVEERKTIGGVWRIKPFGKTGRIFVAACYGGCTVVDMNEGFSALISDYTEHDSMAYGIGALSDNSAVSCSFYDKRVQYWCFS
jgi:diphthamide biosynthesis protein 7